MTDEPRSVSLEALDPTRRSRRFDALVGDITRRASPLLAARRATRRTAFAEIASMRRPLLAAAAAIVLFAGVSLATIQVGNDDQSAVADVAALFEEDTVLTLDDLIEQAHEESR
ncbi:MAG: hypothetical protein ACT4OZ_01315 [Gemmatimonadota bacterium]